MVPSAAAAADLLAIRRAQVKLAHGRSDARAVAALLHPAVELHPRFQSDECIAGRDGASRRFASWFAPDGCFGPDCHFRSVNQVIDLQHDTATSRSIIVLERPLAESATVALSWGRQIGELIRTGGADWQFLRLWVFMDIETSFPARNSAHLFSPPWAI